MIARLTYSQSIICKANCGRAVLVLPAARLPINSGRPVWRDRCATLRKKCRDLRDFGSPAQFFSTRLKARLVVPALNGFVHGVQGRASVAPSVAQCAIHAKPALPSCFMPNSCGRACGIGSLRRDERQQGSRHLRDRRWCGRLLRCGREHER